MSVAYAELAVELPDSPYRMWIDGTLGEYLPLPDGYRVEIIGGEMIISPGPPFSHNRDGTHPKCKWTGYARCGVPFYLVIDCDPKVARSFLYSNPDIAEGSCLEVESWPLGELIQVPDPIGLAIPTDQWRTWS